MKALFNLSSLSFRSNCSLLAIGVLTFACSSESGDEAGVGGAPAIGGSTAGSGGAAAGAGGTGVTGGASSVGGAGTSTGGASGGMANATGGSQMGSGGQASGVGGESAGGSGGDAAAVGGAASGGADGSGGAPTGGEFLLTSPSWAATNNEGCGPDVADAECERFPKENVATNIGGDNLSPELNWTDPPEGTMAYVLVLHDLSNGFGHWAAWNMDATFTGLPAALAEGSPLTDPAGLEQTGITGASYFGSGACGNTYEFILYALATDSYAPAAQADAGAIRDELDASSDVLGTAFVRLRSGEPYCTP